MSDHDLYVSDDKLDLVRIWHLPDGTTVADVAHRQHPDAIWGPPKTCKPEKS